jgi:ribosomal protein S18 acetylase RimI-like enzyme
VLLTGESGTGKE